MTEHEKIVDSLIREDKDFAVRIRKMTKEILVEITYSDGVINLKRPNDELNFWKSLQNWAE